MKRFTLCFLVTCVQIFLNGAYAESLLNGCQINKWNDVNGKPRYYQVVSKDKAGRMHTVYWLKQAENGTYSNVGDYSKTKAAFIINHSPAVAVCQKKKLRLPTKEEFEALANCFESESYSIYLSDVGLGGLYSKFADMEHRWFWTSSAGTEYPKHIAELLGSYYADLLSPKYSPKEVAFIFNGYNGNVGYDYREEQHSVRCVGR